MTPGVSQCADAFVAASPDRGGADCLIGLACWLQSSMRYRSIALSPITLRWVWPERTDLLSDGREGSGKAGGKWEMGAEHDENPTDVVDELLQVAAPFPNQTVAHQWSGSTPTAASGVLACRGVLSSRSPSPRA
jgi:hypothetical protein